MNAAALGIEMGELTTIFCEHYSCDKCPAYLCSKDGSGCVTNFVNRLMTEVDAKGWR